MFNLAQLSATSSPGPLSQIRIIDLSRLVAGNTLTMVLADMGADVIKVEPHAGDTLREWKVSGISTAWKTYSRNKRSISLDFRNPQAKAVLLKLVSTANVLVESFRPGTLEKMGLPPEDLLRENRNLVVARISGWGQDGPYAQRPGFGTLVEGLSGFASMNGFSDREPVLPPIYLGDMTAGLYGAIGVLAALRNVEVSGGCGQVIDVPLLDPLVSILGPQAANYRLTGTVKQRTGSRSSNSAPRNVYRTRDNRWLCLSASTQAMTERLFRAIGRADLITDPRFQTNALRLENVESLDAILSDFVAGKTQAECLTFFENASTTVGPIYDIRDIEQDLHIRERNIVVELPDREMGSIPVHTICPRLSSTPGGFRNPAPEIGEHTFEILEELGYTESAIANLRESGAIKLWMPTDSEDARKTKNVMEDDE
ncbi:MAG TPA: CoA transferase [Acidobacteriaceae bacterium]|jgi:crotonobetainyl-CoA:carnitine CoA-transferase CaiB-like acyl-CoA transferase|nr:CoA transferase [Acidobacteriaceae bacterium]